MDKEQQQNLDRTLTATGSNLSPWPAPDLPKRPGRRPPPWWRGDAAATASNLAAARSMGFTIMEQT